ncbi:MgtC/SapB family protein [Botrimarina sp.]|uniref:MgtC/SapB family protein n=1 Tax=Botrimarina sp. TaxID=2795802 RepID=UPI0032EFD94E
MPWFTDQFPLVSFGEILLRLFCTSVFSIVIGLEREVRQKPAGLRTNVLVALGAAGFVMALAQGHVLLKLDEEVARLDPGRLIQAVAGGIGFLGGGAIFRATDEVRGLTTAATIWVSGAVGVCCGLGQVMLAGLLSFLCLIVLVGLGHFEHRVLDTKSRQD